MRTRCFTAKLPNGVEIWWDGVTRVYIDMPAKLRGKTKVAIQHNRCILNSK